MYKKLIIEKMKEFFKDTPYWVDHTLNVLKNAEDIMEGEGIEGEEAELISIVAILHDIGIVVAREKYGSKEYVYQEREGAKIARKMLDKVSYDKDIDRICFIIGNHHTPSKIDGIDFQIQWEADLLENMNSRDVENEQAEIKNIIEENFKTATGKDIAHRRFIDVAN